MESHAQDESAKETIKFSDYPQRIRINISNSKEKICNAQTDQILKGKSNSKLPRIVRSPSKFYKPTKSSTKLNEKLEHSGDTLPGPSKLASFPMKMKKEDMPEKIKASHIPRRKSNKDGYRESCETTKKSQGCTNNQFIPESKNVQRVHMLINPDFCPEERATPASVATTRPIPTLGQIYGRINMIDSERLNDWFMELNTPMNSATISPRTNDFGVPNENDCACSTVASPPTCHQDDIKRSTIVLGRKNNLLNGFPTNENVNVWLSSDVEFPTRDNESGYKTMSLRNPQKSKQSQLESHCVKTNNTYCLGLTVDSPSKTPTVVIGPCVECCTGTSSLLKEQQTVVLCRTPETTKQKVEEGTDISISTLTLKPTRISKPEANKSHQYPSNVHHNTTAQTNRAPVPSYTDCLSEILQKTTNFEVMEGIECHNTQSSTAVTDVEIRDNLSNEGMTDVIDEYAVVEDQSNPEWSRQQCPSNNNMTFVKSDATDTDWSCRYRSEASGTYTPCSEHHHQDSWNLKHELCKRYFDENRHNEIRERCKKCQRFKRFPSSRYKLPRTFGTWRRGISIRRICRRRWNHVWKKTTERWATWSCRSPARFRRFRVMHYLQRSIIWEDADAQTNVLVYNEASTDISVKEQRSAAIGTVFNMGSWQAIRNNKSESVSKTLSTKSRFRHVNLGPSMFPFLYNSQKRKSLSLQTSDKAQSSLQFPFYQEDVKRNNNTTTDNFTWNTGRAMDVCNSVKSCQYEGVIPVHVEKSTSLLQLNDVKLTDERTDTGDLPYLMNDKVTSTVLRFSSNKLSRAGSKDAYTQKLIMCHNAETDVTFFPSHGNLSTGTFTSGCDITYYRPLTGTDITHLITETRTQQSLYPILRKFTSNATTIIREKSAETETQMSPDPSNDMISTAISAIKPSLVEGATSYTFGPTKTSTDKIEKQDYSAQAETPKTTSTDTETQMTPESSISIMSTGITPSSPTFGDKESTFISACVLLNNEVEKENDAVQTHRHVPNLAFTATKIMSISSRQITSTDVSNTEVTIDKPVTAANGALICSPKCSCKPCEFSSCGTETKSSVYSCTRSTSARGLDSYYETEILLNNLIKKALVGDGASHHSQYSDRSDRDSIRNCPIIYVTTSTNTHVGLESKSIGPTLSETNKLIGGDRTDTGIQYIQIEDTQTVENGEQTNEESEQENKEDLVENSKKPGVDEQLSTSEGRKHMVSMCMLNQTSNDLTTQTDFESESTLPHKCVSMMTSYYGLSESIQVPTSEILVENLETSDKPQLCTCAVQNRNTETSTDCRSLPNLEQPTQTAVLRAQKTELINCNNVLNKSMNSKAELQNNLNNQVRTLSRLIGKKRTSSILNPPITSPMYSSDITAEKWIKECSTIDNNYQSICLDTSDEEDKQKKLLLSSSKSEPEDTNSSNANSDGPPTITLSKDSLADVLPIKKTKDIHIKKQDVLVTVNPVMVDEVTSDDNVTKDVKESILQACPEICETGTESLLQMYQPKSACVLTTHCVLPSPLPCIGKLDPDQSPAECVFVYGEPRCAVHKSSADAGVQINTIETTGVIPPKRGCECHSVGMLTSRCAMSEVRSQRKPSTLIREVLSPKVYKALYETTKLVVNDANQPPVRDTTANSGMVDAEVEAAKFHMADVRSAGVVTSVARGFGFPQRCYCKDRGTHAHNKCALYHVTKTENTTETSSHFTHAKLLQMPEEKEGCFEDCMKTHLVTSCRYYSNLLTKQLGRVKENLTRHLAQPLEDTAQVIQIPAFTNTEACTMKPSGRTELASQTLKYSPYYKSTKHVSCCVLSPAMSLTDICKHDKDHLKSVYYMLSAIEGRLRRLKLSAPHSY